MSKKIKCVCIDADKEEFSGFYKNQDITYIVCKFHKSLLLEGVGVKILN